MIVAARIEDEVKPMVGLEEPAASPDHPSGRPVDRGSFAVPPAAIPLGGSAFSEELLLSLICGFFVDMTHLSEKKKDCAASFAALRH
jgi:hypothetical protein